MAQPTVQEMLESGVHFGHLKRKWNPAMAPYIFMEKNGTHIIDLNKTSAKLDEACKAIQAMARSGKKILFVATKKTSTRNHCSRSKPCKHALCDRKMARWYAYQFCYYS